MVQMQEWEPKKNSFGREGKDSTTSPENSQEDREADLGWIEKNDLKGAAKEGGHELLL